MASSLVCPIVILRNVRPHSNADKLDLCDVLGYQMCVPKGLYKNGDVAVYIPADSLIPKEWAEKWGVLSYLKGAEQNRVGKVRLRGEPSFGLIVDLKWLTPECGQAREGDNVAHIFGIQKYIPPVRASVGDAAAYDEQIDPLFFKFTDVQNGRIFVDVFTPGEEVIVTEKIHGTNCKLGYFNGNPAAGSMEVRRKKPESEQEMAANVYWYPWTLPSVQSLLKDGSSLDLNPILYGEVYGGSIQSLNYGIEKGKGLGFLAFGLSVAGKFLDWDAFTKLCQAHGVPQVPVLYRGPYDFDLIKGLADGKTMVAGSHIREGVVVYPVKERIDPKVGRAIVKVIGTDYALSKHADQDTTDV